MPNNLISQQERTSKAHDLLPYSCNSTLVIEATRVVQPRPTPITIGLDNFLSRIFKVSRSVLTQSLSLVIKAFGLPQRL